MEVTGTVRTGQGTATRWQLTDEGAACLVNLAASLDWPRCEVGTLNLEAAPFATFGPVNPVMHVTVDSEPAVIVKHVRGCAEVMAPIHLRTVLDLSDGDTVTIATDDPRAEGWPCT